MSIANRGKKLFPPRKLKYRKQIQIGGAYVKYIFALAVGLTICTSSVVAFIFVPDRQNDIAYFQESAFLLFWILLATIIFATKARQLANSIVLVYQDKLEVNRGASTQIINFSDIQSIKKSSLSFLSSIQLNLKHGSRFSFSVALERSDYIIESLKKSRPDLLSSEQYQSLLLFLTKNDHNLARLYQMLGSTRGWITLNALILLPLIVLALLSQHQLSYYTPSSKLEYYFHSINLIFGVTWSSFVFLFWMSDTFINRRFSKYFSLKPNLRARDIKYETSVYKKTIPLHFVFCVAAYSLLFRYDTNLYEYLLKDHRMQIPMSKFKDLYWVDKRYNCHGCLYSLNKGDLVILDDGQLAIVQAFANETYFTKEDLSFNSKIGVVVPSGHFGIFILGNSDENFSVVSANQVRGKVF